MSVRFTNILAAKLADFARTARKNAKYQRKQNRHALAEKFDARAEAYEDAATIVRQTAQETTNV